MARGRNNGWVALVIILGLAVGGFLGELIASKGIWPDILGWNKIYGIRPESPFLVDLGVIKFSIALALKVSLGGIIGMLLALVGWFKFR